MVDFGAVYALDGTVIPGAGLRRQLQDSVGEGSGVVRAGDWKVTQMDTPGAGVKIAAGSGLVASRAPGVRALETYGVPLYTAQNYLGDDGAGIPGTGSSVPPGGRRDMMFVEILDPELPTWYTPPEQWPDDASVKLSIIQNVPATAKTMDDVPALANITGYEVAAITYPASTATITDSMIEDLRRLQQPRQLTEVRAFGISGAAQSLTSGATYPSGQTFPSSAVADGGLDIPIPSWATQVSVVSTLSGVTVPGGSNNVNGRVWVQVGADADPDVFRTEPTMWDIATGGGRHRVTLMTSDTRTVPASMRGKTRRFYPRGNKATGPNGESLVADAGTSVVMQVTFREVAI